MGSTKGMKAMAKALSKAQAHKPKAAKKSGGGPAVNKNNVKQITAPAAVGHDYQTYYKEERFQKLHQGKLRDAIRVRGSEYLQAVKIPTGGDNPGVVYNEIYMSPGEFIGTRLELLARLYEKFLFEKMSFKYLPAVGSDTPGQLVIAHDRDISDPTPSADEGGVRQFMAMEDMKAGNVWNPHTAQCPLRSEEDGFFCNPVVGGDDRLAYQGQTYVACVAPTGLADGQTLGILMVEYTCVFFVPQLESGLITNSVLTLNATPPETAVDNTGTTDASYIDVLRWLASAPQLQGLAQYIPKLQADGTYAITVPEGLYDWSISVFEAAVNNLGNAFTATLQYPTIEPLEPSPAPAPQAQVEGVMVVSSPFPAVTIGTAPPAATRAYLNVPRGGARLRQKMQVAGGTSTSVWQVPDLSAQFTRLGAVVQSLLSLIPAPSPLQVKELGLKTGQKLSWQTVFNRKKITPVSPAPGRKCSGENGIVAPAAASASLRCSEEPLSNPDEILLMSVLLNMGMSPDVAKARLREIVRGKMAGSSYTPT